MCSIRQAVGRKTRRKEKEKPARAAPCSPPRIVSIPAVWFLKNRKSSAVTRLLSRSYLLYMKLYLCRYSFFMGILKQIAEYLYLRKPDPNRPKTTFVRYMHGINRLSLLLFIIALIILAIKLLLK